MVNVVKLSSRDERLETAGRWIARMDKGLTPAETTSLQAWMAEHPKNAEVLLSMTKNWDEMGELSRLAELFPANPGERKRPRRLVWAGSLATAAALVVAAVLWLPFGDRVNTDTETIVANANAYETTVGEQSTAILSDGTVVVLNTNSRMTVDYSVEARVLRLERGEIHVDVAHDAARPLSVVAGNHVLLAVGTSFSVEIYQDQQIELVVTEGRVVVGIRTANTQSVHPPPIVTQSSDNIITAGQEIVLGVPDAVVTPVTAEEIEVKLAWREGRLIFRGETLEVALAEVERYTTVEFVFMEQDLRTKVVTGRFRAGDVESLLIALRTNFNITAERSDDNRVLLSSL